MDTYKLVKPAGMKDRKRVGRGSSSGTGKTSGRGQKGQGSRSGFSMRPGFEGGQMPLQRRVPKRGFNNIFKTKYCIINVGQIEKIDDQDIDFVVLRKAGLIKKADKPIKILGNGELTKAKNITANIFSKAAVEKIENAGGKVIKN